MKRLSVFFLIIIAIILFSCGEKTINIGFIGPLTGDAANYGKLMTQAIKIAVEEKNEAGGIDGIKIKFIPMDSEGKSDKANLAIEKLASVDKVWGIVGAVFSGTSLSIAPKCETAKIVMISPSATHKALTSKGKFIFRNVLSDELQAIVFAKYVFNEMGLRRIAVLHIKNDYSQGLAEDFKKVFENEGGVITIVESAVQDDNDFKTQLTKIKQTDSEALFIPNYISEIAQILEQAKQLDINLKMLSADGFTNPEIFKLAGNLANGIVFSGPPNEKTGVNNLKEEFENKYFKKWGEKPDSFSLNSYDGAKILIDAVEKAYYDLNEKDRSKLKINRDIIQKYVANTKGYKGVSGNISFLDNGDALKNVGISISENKDYKQLGVYKIENNNLVKVE